MFKQPTLPLPTLFSRLGKTSQKATGSDASDQAAPLRRDIGPIGTLARLAAGLLLIGIIVYGQLASAGRLSPSTWAFGLIGFPALVLAGHFGWIRHNPARFYGASPLSFLLSIALPLVSYLIGLYVPLLWFTSDATLIFIGSSLVLAAFRGYAGCEFLALSNWLLRRTDQMACAVFTPIDNLDQRRSRS